MDIKHIERPGRRTGNVAAVEIVDAVVAGAPDLAQIVAILHRAAEVGTSGGESTIGAVALHDQQAGTAAEPENLAGIRLQVPELYVECFGAAQNLHRRRDKIAEHGI